MYIRVRTISLLLSEDSEGEGDALEREASDKEKTSVPLPLPDLDRLTSPSTTLSSIFSNPYKEAEEAKLEASCLGVGPRGEAIFSAL